MQAEMYKFALSFGLLRREVVLVNLFPLDKVIMPQGGGQFTPPCYDKLAKTDSRSVQAASYQRYAMANTKETKLRSEGPYLKVRCQF